MIEYIEVKNFRCFTKFKAEGFERVNLIGGKNNSGKTCVLEAIGCFSNTFPVQQLFDLRGTGLESIFNKNYKIPEITITSTYRGNDIKFQCRLNGNSLNDERTSPGININFITQKTELPPLKILQSFDDLDSKLLTHKLINILRIVDERIEHIRTFKTKEGLFIKPVNEQYEPLSNFGDATANLLRYFTPIFEKELYPQREERFTILLIDEIENGLHYTAHLDFWKNIFKLSKELNVQVFSTTHSWEMIKAFNKVAKNEGEGAYFEMAREYETGQIFAQKHDADLLEYELEKTTATFRGE